MKLLPISAQRLSFDLDEIVFENRNKLYGAYILRKHYQQHIGKALLITFSGMLLLALFLQLKGPSKKGDDGVIIPVPDSLIITDDGDTKIIPNQIDQPPAVTNDDIPTAVVPDSVFHDTPLEPKDTTQTLIASTSTGSEFGSNTGSNTLIGSGSGDSTGTKETGEGNGDEIIVNPPIMPSFPGGERELQRYLVRHIYFTKPAEIAEASGKVWISFVVSKSGEIKNVEIDADKVGYGCAEIAKDAVKNMPKWNPGMQNNNPVNVKLVLPVVFNRE